MGQGATKNPRTVLPEDFAHSLQNLLWCGHWNKAELFLEQIREDEMLPNIFLGLGRGQTILHLAVAFGVPARIVKRLLKVIDTEFCFQPDATGKTPIHYCLKHQALDHRESDDPLLLLLLQAMPHSVVNVQGKKLLHHALEMKDNDVCAYTKDKLLALLLAKGNTNLRFQILREAPLFLL